MGERARDTSGGGHAGAADRVFASPSPERPADVPRHEGDPKMPRLDGRRKKRVLVKIIGE